MIVLGIETSCDETGVAIYNTKAWETGKPAFLGILGQGLHSQIAMHRDYGGVVPEKNCLAIIAASEPYK